MFFLLLGSLSDVWRSLVAIVLSGGIVVAAAVLMFKIAVEKFFDAAAKKYEAEIQLAHDKEMENLRSSLRQSEGNLTRVHSRQLTVIDEVYAKIVDAQLAAEAWVNPMQWTGAPSQDELQKEALRKFNDLAKTLEYRRIWLTPDVCVRLVEFTIAVKSSLIAFQLKDAYDKKEQTGVWGKAWDGLKEDAAAIRRALEDDFRRVLRGDLSLRQAD